MVLAIEVIPDMRKLTKRMWIHLTLILTALIFATSCVPQSGQSNLASLLLFLGFGNASGTTREFSPGKPVDLDGNGVPDGIVVDVDGNGIADGIDTDGNGAPDILLLDTNGDGKPDAIDTNGDGTPDYYINPTGNPGLTTGPDGGGSPVNLVDVNNDGHPDGFDTDGDGVVNDNRLAIIQNDTTLPLISVNIPGGNFGGSQSVIISCSDLVGVSQIIYTVNNTLPSFSPLNGTVAPPPNVTVNVGGGGDGTYVLRYLCRDLAGNSSAAATSTYVIDTNIPNITIGSQSSQYVSTVSGAIGSANIQWQSNRNGNYMVLDGGTDCNNGSAATGTNVNGTATAASAISSTIANASFASGANTVRICVGPNLIGNYGSTTTTITKDGLPPTVSSSTPSDTATGYAPRPGRVTVVFSEAMDTSLTPTLTTENWDGTSYVNIPNTGTTFSWVNTTTLQINLSWIYFPENSQIRWTLGSANLKDVAGNAMAANVQRSFTTGVHTHAITPLLRTGQSLCYDEGGVRPCNNANWPSQDGEILSGVIRNFTGPTASGSDYTTTDNVSGFVWKTCTEGQTSSVCTGSASNYTFYNAVNACAYMNTANSGSGYAGRTNWRLATRPEFSTLIEYGESYNSIGKINTIRFPNISSGEYRTSTASASNFQNSHTIRFSDGSVSSFYTKSNNSNFHVLCVSN